MCIRDSCFRQSVGAAVVKHARWLMFQPVTILLFSNWHFPSFLFGICFTRVERNPHNVSMTTVVVDRTGILSNVSIRLRVTCLSQVKSLGSAFADHNRACAELNSGGASFPWVGRPREGGKTCVKGATLFRTLTPPLFLFSLHSGYHPIFVLIGCGWPLSRAQNFWTFPLGQAKIQQYTRLLDQAMIAIRPRVMP